jgi:hypothetical protein
MEVILAERMKMLVDEGVDTSKMAKADEEPDPDPPRPEETHAPAEGEAPPAVTEPPAPAAPVQATPPVTPAAAPEPPPSADDKMVTIVTVDGVEKQVSIAELRQNYQIGSAARQALERASAKEREADEKLRAATAAPAAPAAAATAAPKAPVEEIDWTAKAKELQFGTPEEAGAVLKNLATQLVESRGPASPPIDPDQLVMRAVLIAQDNAEFNGSLAQFGNDYKDIFEGIPVEMATMGGQMANALIRQEIEAAQKEGRPRKPYSDMFRQAGERMRTIVTQIKGPGKDSAEPTPNPATPGTVTVTIDPSKAAAKRASATPPTAAGTASMVGTRPRQAPEVTPEQIAKEGVAQVIAERNKNRSGRLPAAR